MKIHELLSDESKLCRDALAKRADGTFCSVTAPEAVCWCLIGAEMKCGLSNEDRVKLYKAFERKGYVGYVALSKAARELPFNVIHATLKNYNL